MPALRMLGRKWLLASDDLVIPSLIEIPFRIVWLVLLSFVIKSEYSASWTCFPGSWQGVFIRGFLCGILALQAIVILSLAILAQQSAKGTITDSRKLVGPLILWNLFLAVFELTFNIMGSIWMYSSVIECSLTNTYSRTVLHIIVVMTWIRLAYIVISLYLLYDPLGSVHYGDLTDPSSQAWYNKKLTETFAGRLKWALLLLGGDEHSKEAIQEIARLLANLFRSIDLVQSDIVAGCILLRIRQKRITRQSEPVESDESHCSTDVNKIFANCPPWMNLQDTYYYLNLSTAAYGWMYVLFHNFFTGLCLLAPYVSCCCCRSKEVEVIGDNCCMCNYAGIKYISKVPDKDVLYVSFTNKVFEVPFYVIADHERRTIVITIRGTISVPDVFTDLTGTCEPFEVEGLPEGSCAHRGMAMGATKTMQRVMPVLEKAFQEYPNYGLVVTGHSLGAAVSILLGIKLKPKYPQVKVYAFSAPSGLLSREACRYTESFVMMVGLGDDLVMRLGVLSAQTFRDRLVQILHATKLPKYKILLRGFRYAFFKIPDSDLHSTWKWPEDLEAQLLHTPVMPCAFPETDRLYNAGRILHITRHKPTNRKAEKPEPMYKMTWAAPDDFNELLVMPRMLFDHMPEKVHAAIKKILDEHRTNTTRTTDISVVSSQSVE